MKRMISFVLALVLVLTLVPWSAPKAEAATGGKLIALTFDDGPSSKYTKQLLDGLAERGVKVTFFMLGQNADSNTALVKRAYEEGHEIACHSWDHPNLNNLSSSEVKSQMSKTYTALSKACGESTEYLVRPPYGNANSTVKAAISNPLIYWSVDTLDWKYRNSDTVRDNIVGDAFDGAIVLCHDIHKTTVPGALEAIDILLAEGYEFVTVSELYRRRGVEMQDSVFHYSCKPTGTDYGPVSEPVVTYSIPGNGKARITITCDMDAPIYYTLDGTYPNNEATKYTGPFDVPYGTTVRAVAAYKLNGDRSDTVTFKVPTSSSELCATPTVKLNSDGKAVMSTVTPGAGIYYTLNNTAADTGDTLYAGPVSLSGGTYIRAIAADGFHQSSKECLYYYSQFGKLYADMEPSKWFYEAMETLHLAGILNGISEYSMDPNGILNRGMLVTLLYRYSGDQLEENWEKTSTFTDLRSTAFYAEAVEWAYRNGIVNGYSVETFAPNDTVTRQQMCKIMAAYLEYVEKPLPQGESCQDVFGDYDQIARWALESVEAMVGAGLLKGDGANVSPNKGTTRAEFCVVLFRVMDYEANYEPPVEEPEPGEGEETTPGEGEETTPGEGEETTPGEGEETNPGEGEETTPGEGEETTPGEGEETTPGEDEETTPGEGEETTPGEDEETNPGEGEETTPGEDEETNPGEGVETTPGEGEETTPGEGEETTPGEGEEEPSEPEHTHEWKINKTDVSIDVGESFKLYIFCTGVGCDAEPEYTWTPSTADVVSVEGTKVTGLKAGWRTWLRAEVDGVIYECIVRVRADSAGLGEPSLME